MKLLRIFSCLFIGGFLISLSPMKQPLLFEIDCLPCVFESNLISCVLLNENQDSISFYTDTGGKNFLYKSGKKKLGLNSKKGNLWQQKKFSELFKRNNFPAPGVPQFYFVNDKKSKEDGMLGREWFADKIVFIDYAAKEMKIIPQSYPENRIGAPLFFKEDKKGEPIFQLARLKVEIEKDTLSLLLDTGAQAYLSEDMQEKTGQVELVAMSFINASIFNSWKNAHPEWLLYKNGDESFRTKEDIILVPKVTIAGKEIGPIAFASREDYNFKNMSSLFMDEPIQGALGGNALSKLEMIALDYKKRELILLSSDKP